MVAISDLISITIQKIVFPTVGICDNTELYFRLHDSLNRIYFSSEVGNQNIVFSKYSIVSFDTYFNTISIGKWTKYTNLENLTCCLFISGTFKVNFFHIEVNDDVISKHIVADSIVTSPTTKEFAFHFDISESKGGYSFELESLEDNSVFYGGFYKTDISSNLLRYVKIGVGICTFKREKFIKKNIAILDNFILGNNTSPLYGHIEVFIADNGKSLDVEQLESEHIHILPNKNLGGTGGFTRTLLEMKSKSHLDITHTLLMDDDIVIEPDAILRTYALLSLMKDEYLDSCIGGAMLRLDAQNIQTESGAVWNNGKIQSLKKNLNLQYLKNVLLNEIEEYREYNAWWYCCFPISVVKDDNLPLPLFIRGDDVEYGLRNTKNLILMNGICVWHEPFNHKYSSFLKYYVNRNQLIINAVYSPIYNRHQVKRTLVKQCIAEILLYRYKNIPLYLRGVKDFLRGPKWLEKTDAEKLHSEILNLGYKTVPLEKCKIRFSLKQYQTDQERKGSKFQKIMRIFLLNGLLLPAMGTAIVSLTSPNLRSFFRRKSILHYDELVQRGFVTDRNNLLAIKYLFQLILCCLLIDIKMTSAKHRWARDGIYLRTLDFWKKYLEL